MMYIHFCNKCSRFHILNGHKMVCPACHSSLTEMSLPYMEYINMSLREREELLNQCQNEETLKEMSHTYRMYKYSKWYRNQIASEA